MIFHTTSEINNNLTPNIQQVFCFLEDKTAKDFIVREKIIP